LADNIRQTPKGVQTGSAEAEATSYMSREVWWSFIFFNRLILRGGIYARAVWGELGKKEAGFAQQNVLHVQFGGV
jgi:hypothetical protein